MRDFVLVLAEHVGNVTSMWVVILPEKKTCSGGEPRDELVTSADLNLIGASNEL